MGCDNRCVSPVNVPAIGAYIREQREQAKISLRQLAQAAGVSNPYLSQIERGLRRPSADILQQIAKGLRISAEALYVQAGFLEDRPPGQGVRDAVLADSELSERQKQMLVEIYESFRKGGAATTVLPGEVESAAVPVVEPAPGEVEPAPVAVVDPAPGEARSAAARDGSATVPDEATQAWAGEPAPGQGTGRSIDSFPSTASTG
jgi:transcriptional regulator with XRE-family HTH domain